MNFQPENYEKLTKRLNLKYFKELEKIKKELFNTETVIANWFYNHFKYLNKFSEINWHFLYQIQHYLFLKKHTELLDDKVFGKNEDLVFEKWNNSEFADVFLKSLNENGKFKKSALRTLLIFEKHLICFGNRHILHRSHSSKFYRIQTSLGEFEKNKKIHRPTITNVMLGTLEISLLSKTKQEGIIFSKKIESALKIIQKLAPSSWERFKFFTRFIVPINDKEFVSYSHQDLPGFSMINLYHRDFVDLMDDLIHENGHHHLNFYLNTSKLIQENNECIYYSPWRKTLRPLRGIFHAYFTFFWGFNLFLDFSKKLHLLDQKILSSKDKEKIIWRMIEEYYMLNFSFLDLKLAYLQGLIYQKGWNLIEEQQRFLKENKDFIKKSERKLKLYQKELNNLKLTLKIAKKKFVNTKI